MERNRTGQVIAILALVVGVVSLSIGFASFSSVLNIQASANVKPDRNTMNVDFSSAVDKVEVAEIVPTTTPPIFPVLTLLPPRTRITNNSLAPELSATFKQLSC